MLNCTYTVDSVCTQAVSTNWGEKAFPHYGSSRILYPSPQPRLSFPQSLISHLAGVIFRGCGGCLYRNKWVEVNRWYSFSSMTLCGCLLFCSTSSWGPGSRSHGACPLPQNSLWSGGRGDHRHPRPDPLQEALHLRSSQAQTHPGRAPWNPLHCQTVRNTFTKTELQVFECC